MSARRKRVISTEEIHLNHKPAKMLLIAKKKGVSQNGHSPNMIEICSYCVLDRPAFERCQTLLHPELTPWWSFLCADGAHHKKPHSPTHPLLVREIPRRMCWRRWRLLFGGLVSGDELDSFLLRVLFPFLHFACVGTKDVVTSDGHHQETVLISLREVDRRRF